MATLNNQNIQDTYQSLIKTENNECLAHQSGRINLSDGFGNCSSLSIGKQSDTAGAKICGPLITSGNATIGGTLNASGLVCTTGKICANDCIDTDKNLVASQGGLLRSISVGRSSHGTILVDSADRSYETIQLKANHNLRFFFGTNQKARLNNSGTFCTDGRITAKGFCSTDSINTTCDVFAGNATFNGIVTTTGAIRGGGDVIAFYSSDKNLKNNIKELDTNNIIESINSYEFDWNNKADREGKGFGFIAQEVKEVLAHAVKESNDGYLGVDYIQFIPVLLNEIKELKARVNKLENA